MDIFAKNDHDRDDHDSMQIGESIRMGLNSVTRPPDHCGNPAYLETSRDKSDKVSVFQKSSFSKHVLHVKRLDICLTS